jgi:hypothetical protein
VFPLGRHELLVQGHPQGNHSSSTLLAVNFYFYFSVQCVFLGYCVMLVVPCR